MAPAHNYLRVPSNYGRQPALQAPNFPALRRVGPRAFHTLGCRQDGGAGLPPGACLKCGPPPILNLYSSESRQYIDTGEYARMRSAMRSDRRERRKDSEVDDSTVSGQYERLLMRLDARAR